MNSDVNNIFFELLRYSIGSSKKFEQMTLTREQWEAMHEMAVKQTVLGVCFNGLKKLPHELRPSKLIFFSWFAEAESIEKKNKDVNICAYKLSRGFKKKGFCSCLLKGQGNAMMYPNPMMRTSGDIDMWMVPMGEKLMVDDDAVLHFVRTHFGPSHFCYHHVDVPDYHDVGVEIHYRPSFMNNLLNNRKLQDYFKEHLEEQFHHEQLLPDTPGPVAVPTTEFNVVFQMAHLSNHFFNEGLGLRQLMDYYFLLKKRWEEWNGTDKDVSAGKEAELFKHLGLYKYATAVMWVLKEVFSMPEEWMVVPASRKRGKFLLSEIMLSGNFGQFDERVGDSMKDNSLGRNIQRLRRDVRLMRRYPSECLWEPVFRLWHYRWRRKHRNVEHS